MAWIPIDLDAPTEWAISGDFVPSPVAIRLVDNLDQILEYHRPITNKWWSLGWSSDTDPDEGAGANPGDSTVIDNIIGHYGRTIVAGDYKPAMQFSGTGLQFSTPRNQPMTIPIPVPRMWRRGRQKMYVTVAGRVSAPAADMGFYMWARYGTARSTYAGEVPGYRIGAPYPAFEWEAGSPPEARGENAQLALSNDMETAVEGVQYYTFQLDPPQTNEGPALETRADYVYVTFLANRAGTTPIATVDPGDCEFLTRGVLEVKQPGATLLPDQPFGPLAAEMVLPRANVDPFGTFIDNNPTTHFVTHYGQGYLSGNDLIEPYNGRVRFQLWPPVAGAAWVGVGNPTGPMGFRQYGVNTAEDVELYPLPTMLVYGISVHWEER